MVETMKSEALLSQPHYILVCLFMLTLTQAQGDMGSITKKRGVTVNEPRQDAIIAWNGEEQLLYLQTTLKTSEPTTVLEVMPLPSRPTVELSDVGVFQRCQYLLPKPSVKSSGGAFGGPPRKAAEVVEKKELGVHKIEVVKLLDADHFQAWVKEHFSGSGGDFEVPEPLLKVIGEYAADGYEWFLFDLIEVNESATKKQPLRIQFATDHLNYPMRITRTEKGRTKVTLSVLTSVPIEAQDCVGIPRNEITLVGKPREISGGKIRFIDPPIYDLLGLPQSTFLSAWSISGEIDSFTQDLLIQNPALR